MCPGCSRGFAEVQPQVLPGAGQTDRGAVAIVKRLFFHGFLADLSQEVLDHLVEHFVAFASEPVIVRAALLLNLGFRRMGSEMLVAS